MSTTFASGMTNHRLQLSSPTAMRLARRAVEGVSELADFPDLRFAARLLASELVANSYRHSGMGGQQPVELLLDCDLETFRLEVRDRGSGFDALALLSRHLAGAERYHGLFLVDALADRWGFRRGSEGSVWFELDLVPGRRAWRGRESIV
jgi:anti-sigma regulatory factor (Ser/Thr protein kinase)